MAKKELKRRGKTTEVSYSRKWDNQELEHEAVEPQETMGASVEMDGNRLEDVIKRLRDRKLYYETYAEFIESESNDGAYVERDERTGMTTMYIKADSPSEAMDKLADYGFISVEEAALFKSRFEELEARGVDVSTIKGGDLSILRDNDLFEEFAKMAQEAQEQGEPVKLYDRVDVEASMFDRKEQPAKQPTKEQTNEQEGPDVIIPRRMSDEDLLAKLNRVQEKVGIVEPDNKPNYEGMAPKDRELLEKFEEARVEAGLNTPQPDGHDLEMEG